MTHEDQPAVLRPLKTWSHLAGGRRRPSEYEIVSVKTLFNTANPERPLELDTNVYMNRWLRQYRNGSPLKHTDWHGFRDPDELTYRAYTSLQNDAEIYVDGLLNEHDELGHDLILSEAWLTRLALLYTPLRYLLHTLQMCSAYLLVVAPASTIDNCAAMQMADQYRWLSRIAYRTAELRKHHPTIGFGDHERERWENHPAWQGARELMEKLLTTYDWGEAFVALNLVAKPALEEGLLRPLARASRASGDSLLGFLIDAQLCDAERSRHWTRALTAYALKHDPANHAAITHWIAQWDPLADAAVGAYCAELPGVPDNVTTAKTAVQAFQQACLTI